MKKVFSLAVLLCFLAGSAMAAAPEAALKALSLGNEMHTLEKSLKAKPLAIVVMDESIAQEPAALFNLAAEQIGAVRAPFAADTGLTVAAKDITAPLMLVLGLDEAAVWAVYANTLAASPDLIHAVLKGQVAVQGALLDAETGAVKLLGSHPEQQTMVGRYLLGMAAAAPGADKAQASEEKPAAEKAEPAEAHADVAAPAADHAEPAAAGHDAPAADAHAEAASEGGSGFMLIILFVVALVGAVVFLDKVVLKD